MPCVLLMFRDKYGRRCYTDRRYRFGRISEYRSKSRRRKKRWREKIRMGRRAHKYKPERGSLPPSTYFASDVRPPVLSGSGALTCTPTFCAALRTYAKTI